MPDGSPRRRAFASGKYVLGLRGSAWVQRGFSGAAGRKPAMHSCLRNASSRLLQALRRKLRIGLAMPDSVRPLPPKLIGRHAPDRRPPHAVTSYAGEVQLQPTSPPDHLDRWRRARRSREASGAREAVSRDPRCAARAPLKGARRHALDPAKSIGCIGCDCGAPTKATSAPEPRNQQESSLRIRDEPMFWMLHLPDMRSAEPCALV